MREKKRAKVTCRKGFRDKHITSYSFIVVSQAPKSGVLPLDALRPVNPLMGTVGNYNAVPHRMKLVHWPLMGGLLHLVQRGGDWAGPQLSSE